MNAFESPERKPKKVLIADDEYMICRLIQSLIPWEELGLELAAMVSNGTEAKKFLSENSADILITDARMPECDGIELVKWCHEQSMKMKYIVISGYRHFEYAHSAIKYGVDGYLLKPINQEELIGNLRDIIDKIDEEKNHSDQNIRISKQIDQNRDKMRRHFISSYIFDGRDFQDRKIESVENINEEYQMNFSEGIFRAIFIKLDNRDSEKYELENFVGKISDMADEMCNAFMAEVVKCPVHSGIMLFINYKEEYDEKLQGILSDMYSEIVRIIDVIDGVKATIGVSHRENSLKNMGKCIVTAADAIKYRLCLPHVTIIYHDNYSFKKVPVTAVWTTERSRLMGNYLRTGNEKGIQKLLFDIKQEIRRDKELDPVIIYEIVKAIADRALDEASAVLTSSEKKSALLQSFLLKLDNMENIDSIIDCLEEMISETIDLMNEELKQQEIQPIRLIREFIDKHYMENISLVDVAEEVKLSRNYVSAIFRKETGVNFLDYLTAKRMDEAAKLLRKTDLSISEVAERVGYFDVKYFSKMCKKNLGMSPSEYRKLYS